LSPLTNNARAARLLRDRAQPSGAATALASPLAAALTTMRAGGRPAAPQARTVAAAEPASPGLVRRRAPAAGVLAALTALAALGLAGAARSSNGLAACFDLARLPFPRFRILPCPGDVAPGAAELGASTGAGLPAGTAGGGAARDRGHRVFGRLPALRLPRLSGVLGGAVESDQPWKFLNALLLALLLGANLFLVGVRSRIARLQSR